MKLLSVLRNIRTNFPYLYSADWTTPHEEVWRSCLECFAGAPGIRYLEIGVFQGRSTIWLMNHVFNGPGCEAWVVDHFRHSSRLVLWWNLAIAGHFWKVKTLKGASQDILPLLDDSNFHVIYVDAGHTAEEVKQDLCAAWKLLKPSGVLILDDYLWEKDGLPRENRPQVAIDEFLGKHGPEMEILHQGWQVLCRRH